MRDALGPNAPHLREPQPEPDGAMELAAFSILITALVALIIAGVLCL